MGLEDLLLLLLLLQCLCFLVNFALGWSMEGVLGKGVFWAADAFATQGTLTDQGVHKSATDLSFGLLTKVHLCVWSCSKDHREKAKNTLV